MRLITLAIAVSLLVVLTACTPGASPTPPPPASESPKTTATVEAVDEEEAEPAAATILLRTDFFAILDEDDAVMAQFDYFDAPDEAIAALSEVFGGAPTITAFEGYTHQWPGNYYSWEGFTLIDWVGGGGIAYGEDFAVSTAAAVVRGLAVETVGGITVGSTGTEVLAAGGTEQSYSYDGVSANWFEVDAVAGTDPEWAEWEGGPRIYVNAAVETAAGPVTVLTAPVANYGV